MSEAIPRMTLSDVLESLEKKLNGEVNFKIEDYVVMDLLNEPGTTKVSATAPKTGEKVLFDDEFGDKLEALLNGINLISYQVSVVEGDMIIEMRMNENEYQERFLRSLREPFTW